MRVAVPKRRSMALATAALFTSISAFGAAVYGIVGVDESNLRRFGATDEENYVFPTTATGSLTPADANGYLVIDAEEGVVAPGVAAYQESFRSGGENYNGCVMASKEDPSKGTCNLGPDSGKRFKLRATKLNKPIDIVLDVSTAGQTTTLLYNVYGKLTNETGKPATGFRVQIGKGIGADFVKSTATDGVSLKPTRESKGGTTPVPLLGKFPGGLFGGSQVEGLPFFTTAPANFNDVTQDGDTLIANSIPRQYADLFGQWQSKETVPVSWAFDVDGRPWTDDRLLAWEEGGKWYTFERNWTKTIQEMLAEFDGGDTVDLGTIPANLNPLVNEFADIRELTRWLNQQAGYAADDKDAYTTGDVVDALVSGLTLTRKEVEQDKLDTWAANPVTVRYSTDAGLDNPTLDDAIAAGASWPTIATWHPELGEEGLYVLEPGYDSYPEIVAIARTDLVAGKVVATAEDMETVVADNTSATTKFFAIPGYSMGEIEDLSNVNTFYAIEVEPFASPTEKSKVTLRITLTDDSYVPPSEPTKPADPTDPTDPSDPTVPPTGRSSSGGCTIANGDAPFDPTLPLLLVGGVAAIALRRRAAR